MTSAEAAFTAGLFEGEGTVTCSRHYWGRRGSGKRLRQTPSIRLRIQMTNIEPLERIAAICGGYINGPYQHPGNRRPVYVWTLGNVAAIQDVVAVMWEWLSLQRQAQLGELLAERLGLAPA
jgi:hypothetical protein